MNDLTSNARLFALLGSMYLCKPTLESLVAWRQLLEEDSIDRAGGVKQALNAIDLSVEQELEDILWEYTRLFIGPHRLPCPPWESVYTSPKRLMMQEAYDEVQECYRRAEVELGNDDVMADHVGAELNFMAVLFERMAGETEQTGVAASAEEFMEGHLRNWVPRFTADLEGAADSGFYRVLAQTTREAVAVRQGW